MAKNNKFNVINNQEKLSKRTKRWVTISLSTLALLGLGTVSAIHTNADSNQSLSQSDDKIHAQNNNVPQVKQIGKPSAGSNANDKQTNSLVKSNFSNYVGNKQNKPAASSVEQAPLGTAQQTNSVDLASASDQMKSYATATPASSLNLQSASSVASSIEAITSSYAESASNDVNESQITSQNSNDASASGSVTHLLQQYLFYNIWGSEFTNELSNAENSFNSTYKAAPSNSITSLLSKASANRSDLDSYNSTVASVNTALQNLVAGMTQIKPVPNAKHGYTNVYSNVDGIKAPAPSYSINSPVGWAFVDQSGNKVDKINKDSNGNYLIAPAYKGVVFKYHKDTDTLEFTNGTFHDSQPENGQDPLSAIDDNIGSIIMNHSSDMLGAGGPSKVIFDRKVSLGNITNLSFMFSTPAPNPKVVDFSNLDMSKVTSMYYMFGSNIGIESIVFPKSLDTAHVDMSNMFAYITTGMSGNGSDGSLAKLVIESPNTKFATMNNGPVDTPEGMKFNTTLEGNLYKVIGIAPNGQPYTSSTPNDFTQGNIGTFTALKNPLPNNMADDTIIFKDGNNIINQENKIGNKGASFSVADNVPSGYAAIGNTSFIYDGKTHIVPVNKIVHDTVIFKHGDQTVATSNPSGPQGEKFSAESVAPANFNYNVFSVNNLTYDGQTHVVEVGVGRPNGDQTIKPKEIDTHPNGTHVIPVQMDTIDTIQFKHGSQIIKTEQRQGQENTNFDVIDDVPRQYNEYSKTSFMFNGGTHVVQLGVSRPNNNQTIKPKEIDNHPNGTHVIPVQMDVIDTIQFKHGSQIIKSEQKQGPENSSFDVINDVPSQYNVNSGTKFVYDGNTHVVQLGVNRPNGFDDNVTPTPVEPNNNKPKPRHHSNKKNQKPNQPHNNIPNNPSNHGHNGNHKVNPSNNLPNNPSNHGHSGNKVSPNNIIPIIPNVPLPNVPNNNLPDNPHPHHDQVINNNVPNNAQGRSHPAKTPANNAQPHRKPVMKHDVFEFKNGKQLIKRFGMSGQKGTYINVAKMVPNNYYTDSNTRFAFDGKTHVIDVKPNVFSHPNNNYRSVKGSHNVNKSNRDQGPVRMSPAGRNKLPQTNESTGHASFIAAILTGSSAIIASLGKAVDKHRHD